MAEETTVLTNTTVIGPLEASEREVLAQLTGRLGEEPDPRTTPDATVVLDGTTVRLGPESTAAVLTLLARLATGATLSVSEQDRWLNTSQAARLAGVSNTYLRQLADRGEIPVSYRGSHRRIHPEDVLAWVRRRDAERAEQAAQDPADADTER